MSDITPDQPAAAIGRIPSGLFILTARNGEHEAGMLASWVQQCGFTPLQLSVALAKDRPLVRWLVDDNVPLVVNVLPEGATKLVAHFGKGFDPGEPAFDGVDAVRDRAAAPVLTAATAFVECRVAGWADATDHIVFILEAVGGAVLTDGKPAVHTRKNGLKY